MSDCASTQTANSTSASCLNGNASEQPAAEQRYDKSHVVGECYEPDPDDRLELDRMFVDYDKNGQYPESLIKRLCQHFTKNTARKLIADIFGCVNYEVMTSHKDYNVKCPTEFAKDDAINMRIAEARMLELLQELTEAEMQRLKVFLGDVVVEGVRHIPYGIIEDMKAYKLADVIISRLYGQYKCVMFAILTTLDRNDLITYLQVPCDTTVV